MLRLEKLSLCALLAASCAGATLDGSNNNGGGGGSSTADGDLLTARVRRVSNGEYDRTVATLLGTSATPGRTFATDLRQSGFTLNAAQTVDPVYAGQLQGAARTLAQEALARVLGAAACANANNATEACAAEWIAAWVPQAFRRPITDDEKKDLLGVFRAGAQDGTFRDGIELVVTAVLQSGSFIYLTELGEGARGRAVNLGGHELANALAYLITGSPPDAELRTAAPKLTSAAEREAQARRLLAQPAARAQVQRLVKEWLGIDKLENTGKDNQAYPRFEELRPLMAKETDAFIEDVAFGPEGSLKTLLAADHSVLDQTLARFYGLPGAGSGRTPLGTVPRRGLLMQGSFLAVHGHDTESAPVIRGVVVLEKLLCQDLPTPAELNLDVVPPAPDPKLTTRERFTAHSAQPSCKACHDRIDPIGFALENFDGMGGQRTMESGKPVDTSAVLGAPLTGRVKDGTELVAQLADHAEVRRCFARNFFRFAAAKTDAQDERHEEVWLKVWAQLPPERQSNFKELLVAWAASDLFLRRRVP